MRYRFSWWDPAIAAAALAASLGLGNAVGVIVTLATYVFIRLVDFVFAQRKPEQYGFVTNAGGGMAFAMLVLVSDRSVAELVSIEPGLTFATLCLASAWTYTGLLFWLTPAERIPHNAVSALGTVTVEQHRAMCRGIGIGLVASGIVAAALGFLPGELAMLSLAALCFGPVVGLAVGNGRRTRT